MNQKLDFENYDFSQEIKNILKKLEVSFKEVELISYSVNKNYLIKGPMNYFCRIYRPLKENLHSIQAEHKFLYYLKEHGINCACPIKFANQAIHQISFDNELLFMSFFEYINGTSLPKQHWDHQFIYNWGNLLGNIHQLSKTYPKPQLQRLNWDNIEFHLNIIVQHSQSDLLKREHESILQEFSSWPKDKNVFGLVHYDLHQGNLLQTNKHQLFVIDFDDLCYHWYIWDFAIIWHRLSSGFMKQDQQHLKNIFLQGYKSNSELPYFFESKLNFIERARHFFMVNWLSYRKHEQKWCAISENYLHAYMKFLQQSYDRNSFQ